MNGPSDNGNSSRETRIRTIAYALWEEEGRPEGCAEAYWFRASELAAAPSVTPSWLKREPTAETLADLAMPAAIEEIIQRMAGGRAA